MADSDSSVRTLVVGLDAACPAVLDRLFAAGATPALARLFDCGTSAALESQLPPWTPSAWPSLYTGVNPGKHGVYGFLAFDGYEPTVVDRTDVRAHALWELADRHGLGSVVVNVPVTHPPRPVDGAVVPGYVAPEEPDCHPPGLLGDLRRAVGDYRVYAPQSGDATRRLDWFKELARMRGRAFRHLVEEFEPDLGFVQFQVTDTVFHERPGDWDAVGAVYRAVDRQVGEILAACEPDAVFVVSDHGIGEYDGVEFRVNEHLRQHGYVETTRGGGTPSWDAISRRRLRDDGGSGGLLVRPLALAARTGLTSQRIRRALDRVGLADAVARVVPADLARVAAETVDRRASTAYVRSRIELGVRLNVAGREPEGVVPPDDYEWVRGEVASCLAEARTPDGEPVFDAVLPREEVYHGPHVEHAPDLVTVPAGFDHLLSGRVRDGTTAPPSEPYNHKLDGVIAAAGPAVDADADLAGAHIFDVAPTVLASLGVPAAERFDGSVLPVVEPAGIAAYPAFESRSPADGDGGTGDDATGDGDDAGDVEQRLSDLGYLE